MEIDCAPAAARKGGHPRGTDLREVMNGILYPATGGCQWRMTPMISRRSRRLQRYFLCTANHGDAAGN